MTNYMKPISELAVEDRYKLVITIDSEGNRYYGYFDPEGDFSERFGPFYFSPKYKIRDGCHLTHYCLLENAEIELPPLPPEPVTVSGVLEPIEWEQLEEYLYISSVLGGDWEIVEDEGWKVRVGGATVSRGCSSLESAKMRAEKLRLEIIRRELGISDE